MNLAQVRGQTCAQGWRDLQPTAHGGEELIGRLMSPIKGAAMDILGAREVAG